jgi:hypothetical protein
MSIVVGVDPGLDGALCLLGGDAFDPLVTDLPTKADEATGRRVDGVALANLLQKAIPADVPVRICIEALAHGGQGKGRTNAFTVDSQTWTQSALVTTLELLGLEVAEFVHVQTWKKLYGLRGKKGEDASVTQRRVRELAVGLYPSLADKLQRQKDHNRAEAILIAHWFRKVRG